MVVYSMSNSQRETNETEALLLRKQVPDEMSAFCSARHHRERRIASYQRTQDETAVATVVQPRVFRKPTPLSVECLAVEIAKYDHSPEHEVTFEAPFSCAVYALARDGVVRQRAVARAVIGASRMPLR